MRFESNMAQKLAKLMISPQNLNLLVLGLTMKFFKRARSSAVLSSSRLVGSFGSQVGLPIALVRSF